ncbi:hypothetical protein LMG19144_03981 [Xanthomonas arboricola pv. fragariae]|nr:hypothetical protein LMG19144_03981 [Xanthomonas arboricola pv. fragariae]
MPGQPIGAPVQCGVADLLIGIDRGDRIGRARHLRFEQRVHQSVGTGAVGGVEVLHHLPPRCGIEQAQRGERTLRILDDLPQHVRVRSGPTRDRVRIEQVARVVQRAYDAIARLSQRQRHVELCGIAGHGQRLHGQPRQAQMRLGYALPDERRLEQRCMCEATRWLQGFDHVFERHVGVLLRLQHALARMPKQLADTRIRVDIDAQHQHVDEEPDQTFQLLAKAVCGGTADQHAGLTAQARQQHAPASQQRRKHRHAMSPAARLECNDQLWIQLDADAAAAITLDRRPWPIAGQLGRRRRIGQCPSPIRQLLFQPRPLEPLSLPLGVVGELDAQGRQRIVLVPRQRVIERAELVSQDAHRPRIGDDVMHGDEQHVLVRAQSDQAATHQRAALQIEGLRRLVPDDIAQALAGVFHAAQVVLANARVRRGAYRLISIAIDLAEGGAQGLMPLNDQIQRIEQCTTIQRAAQAQPAVDVVGAIGPLQA